MGSNENASAWFVDRNVDAGFGAKVAFREIGSGRVLTYDDLQTQSRQLAGAFRRIGMRREERVACLMLDQIEYPAIFFGAMKAGVVPVLLNTLLSADLYDAILRDCRAAVLVVSAELWEVVAPIVADNPYLRRVVVLGDAPAQAMSFTDFLDEADEVDIADVSADDCAFWLYSSGSTGRPKGVRHVHSAMRATAETYGAQVLGIQNSDVVLSAAKIFFAYGLGNAITFPMSVGATTLLWGGRPTPGGMLEALSKHKPTVFCGVPTLYAAMVAEMQINGVPDHALRLCISAGEALPKEVGEQWQALTGAPILDGVGSTEMLHIFLSNAPGDVQYGTSGLAVPGYDLRLVDDTGEEVAPDTVGELLVRGASAADGYWNQRDKSRATFEGAWTRTGDKYERRGDGRYIYCGRTDDMFKVSGIWVSPFEVEQALASHPAVLESAVVPKVDEEGLEKPKAFVVLKTTDVVEDLEASLKSHVKDKIGKWKYPRWIELVEDLPKTATGKIQRFKLREMG